MRHESIQEMFSRTAAEYGGEVAIDRVGQQVKYGELEAESNRLGNYLREQGVGAGTMVGLLLEETSQIVTGILGVLKAGAVFVPLDPTFPDRRLGVMSEQVQAGWYVTVGKHLEKLRRVRGAAERPARVICLDEAAGNEVTGTEVNGLVVEREYERYERREAVGLASDPEAPCSVYFSSGSTGRPKAILGRLKGIDHFMRWEIEAVGAKAGTRVSQLASPSFDGFLKDVFVPLSVGGVVCVPQSREVILDAWSLADWLDVEQVEVLHCVPSVFRALLNEGLNDRYFEALRCVVLTGEHLYPSDVKRWFEIFGERIKLLNIYGTTETSLSKFHYEVKPEDVERPSIPVGKPIKGAAVMIINSRGQICREEAVGEIYIRTPYRSHGYYLEPELTAEVFVPNPFSDDPNDIVHKTGDYGRLLKGGDLEHLGRRDQQVQIRGVRVELGELENLLRGHETVADVAVVDRDDADGNKFLVAYVNLSNGGGTEPLRTYLRERLPETMVPSAFVELDQLPRTLNGKIDRKALPALELLQAEQELEAGALTPVEEIVGGIWCEVLRLPSVGRKGNFFNLGGHSLLMTQVLARIREYLRVELPIRSMFEAPTVAELAALIEEQINAGRQRELTAIGRVSREGELPLSYPQQRMWFFEQLARGSSAFNIALGVRLKGALNVAALEQTFSEILRRHEGLRTVFPAVNDQPVQRIQAPRRFRLPLVDLSRLAEPEREAQAARLAQEETLRRFDLGQGPLVRPLLLRLATSEHVVVCTMHHIIGDGQSFEVVIAELSQLYGALSAGGPSPLAELSVQYVDYAGWEREWLQGEELERRLSYWRQQLAGAPARLSLPQQRQRPKVQTFGGARQTVNFTRELTAGLRELSRREGLTLFMTLLSGFVLLLNRYTGDEDIVVGSTYANRERAEAEKLIGMLAITLVLRVDLNEATTFRELLKRVREVCLDAYSYQLTPELLREDLAKRGEERDRLFDVWFQLDKERKEQLTMKGMEVVPYLQAKEVSRFELSMALGERDEDIVGVVDYDEDIFTSKTIAQMLQDYSNLLTTMVAEPDRDLKTVSLTSKHDIERLSSAFVASLEI